MTGTARESGKRLSRTERLAQQFKKEKFRKSYFARQLGVAAAGGSAAGAGGPASKFRGQTVLEAANRRFEPESV
jgi:hypothetical protein